VQFGGCERCVRSEWLFGAAIVSNGSPLAQLLHPWKDGIFRTTYEQADGFPLQLIR
jgi:hypothetical protein